MGIGLLLKMLWNWAVDMVDNVTIVLIYYQIIRLIRVWEYFSF